MSRHLLYIAGEPGSGKTTTVHRLIHSTPYGWPALEVAKPFKHVHIQTDTGTVVHLGPLVGRKFPGTDALSMSVQPHALAYLREQQPPLVLAEGDRLATLGFLRTAASFGYNVQLVILHTPDAATRRAQRAIKAGLALQNEGWVQSRVSKIRNLAGGWPGHTPLTDPDPATLAQISPVAAALAALPHAAGGA